MLDANGDYTFGQGAANFFANDVNGIAQSILTRLKLMQGEWFLDLTEGTPYSTQVLGKGTRALYDQAIKTRILQTVGVTAIILYSSTLINRKLTINCHAQTIYGPLTITTPLTVT